MTVTTTRLAIPTPSAGDSANAPVQLLAMATILDAAGLWGQGLLSARGAATGIQGRFYWATDTQLLYINTGTAWVAIGPAGLGADSITTAMLQALSVTTAKLADGSVTTVKIADANVTAAKIAALAIDTTKIAAALKPTGGAGAGTESLRALGTTAGTALAGDAAVATPVTAATSASRTNGQTYTITAPVAGTYILEYGIAAYSNGGQGQTCTLTPSTGGPVVTYGDVGAGGGSGLQTALALTAGQVVTITVGSNGSCTATGCWAKLTRIA